MNIQQFGDTFLDIDKVTAFRIDTVQDVEQLAVVTTFQLSAIADGVAIPLKRHKEKGVLIDEIQSKFRTNKKGVFN